MADSNTGFPTPAAEEDGTCPVPECQDGSIRLPYVEERPTGKYVLFRWYDCGECNGYGTASGEWERRVFPPTTEDDRG